MKTLFNNKGAALIILIIAMTLISVLGASMVSIMGAKQRGFVYQADSYRAFNLANAGVEYAMRYVGSSTDPTGNNLNDFFHNPSNYANIKVVSTAPNISNLSDAAQWKRFDFDNGQFYISYHLNPSDPDNVDTNKILYSVGIMKETKRVVKLKKFLTYAAPTSSVGLDKLNLVPIPNQQPYISGNYVVVPVINLTTNDITISSIRFEANLNNNLTKEFTDIYIRNWNSPGGTNIYNANSYPDACPGSLPCRWDWPWVWPPYIEIPDNGPVTKPLNVTAGITVPASSIRWFSFRFNESGSDLRGIYTITFNFSGGPAIIKFSL